MIKKPHNWDSIIKLSHNIESPYAVIVSYYLSRFDKEAYKNLGDGNNQETHLTLDVILNSKAGFSTIRNYRDMFDSHFPNPRKGWGKPLRAFHQEIYDGFANYSEQEVYTIVRRIFKLRNIKFKYLFDTFTMLDSVAIFTDEVKETKTLKEGDCFQIETNAYERNIEARKQCIEYHGLTCFVCSFNFEETFGEIGKGFIHVHHLTPLSEIKQEYEVDPIQDLCPVCPNCHAMIHTKNPPFSIEEIKDLHKSK
jgi:5-methylcytosine-specific restriction protein A